MRAFTRSINFNSGSDCVVVSKKSLRNEIFSRVFATFPVPKYVSAENHKDPLLCDVKTNKHRQHLSNNWPTNTLHNYKRNKTKQFTYQITSFQSQNTRQIGLTQNTPITGYTTTITPKTSLKLNTRKTITAYGAITIHLYAINGAKPQKTPLTLVKIIHFNFLYGLVNLYFTSTTKITRGLP